MAQPLLSVRDLHVSFATYGGEVQAVRGVSFDVAPGETLAIVGESGSGKSVTMQAVTRLLPMPPAIVRRGQVIFDGRDLLKLPEPEMQKVRGGDIGLIFQDPMTSLNPTMTIGRQIAENILKHNRVSRREAFDRAVEMLRLVGIPNPRERALQYPHQFSGGMRQRAMIAIALASRPRLLIADEPTTALDVTIQAQILELMKKLQEELGMAIIMITHNLGVVAKLADRIVVMYGGKVVESGSARDVFYRPQHPYTAALLRSVPRLDADTSTDLASIPGTPPDLFNPPPGCPFAPRCQWTMKICSRAEPEFFVAEPGHLSACWLHHPMAEAQAQRRAAAEGGVTHGRR
ncbi:MAG: ABC transporter ATP-binding protein [Firmicutes bacterium]|nr:ABC transporter ATP-binding protein [Bacillota bacterium]